ANVRGGDKPPDRTRERETVLRTCQLGRTPGGARRRERRLQQLGVRELAGLPEDAAAAPHGRKPAASPRRRGRKTEPRAGRPSQRFVEYECRHTDLDFSAPLHRANPPDNGSTAGKPY